MYDATRSLPPGVESRVASALAELLGGELTLEIGVGTARWARALETRGVQVVGIDLSRKMLSIARVKGAERILQGEVSRTPFRDGTFEGVLSNHVLHLVGDVRAALLEVVRVSKGPLRSVLDYETSNPDLMRTYSDLVEHAGSRPGAPGLPERELARELPPDRIVPAAEFELKGPAEPTLSAIESRAFRDTWAASDEVHRVAVAELRARFGAAEVLSRTRVEIGEWARGRLLEFSLRRSSGHAGSRPSR
ncbi:MAG: class I SAM-dependent methyltransferase [Thermoplasmata archaeon]|nr:class I SAM-dependent methyltransferase [Thermoplasmata archaeon]